MSKAEVTVHIWRPMKFNIGGPKTDDHKQISNPYKSSGIVESMLETFLGEWQRYFGHTSLSVNWANHKPIYLSFWPKEDEIMTILGSAFGNKKLGLKKQDGVFRTSIEEDLFYMSSPVKGQTFENTFSKVSSQKEINLLPRNKGFIITHEDGSTHIFGRDNIKLVYPDEDIQLLLPDGEAIYKHVSSLIKKKKQYDLFDSNCSTLVTEALKKGTESLKSNILEDVMASFERVAEATKLMAIFAPFFSGQSDAHKVKYLVETHGISLTNSLATIIEAQGKATPNTVKRYVERLRKKITS
jgi:hypothetical protein